MDMAKKPHKKLTLTEKYERRRIWAGYFGIAFKEMKRATQKALKAINKAIKHKRLELKQEGVTDIPTVAQVAKYEKQSQQLSNDEEKEALPYADINDIPEFNEYEAIINQFIDTMQEALSESVKIYGMSQPWLARTFENAILGVMAKFNEARAKLGDAQLAQNIADSLDYEQIITLIAYDYNEALDMLDNMASVFDSMITDWNT